MVPIALVDFGNTLADQTFFRRDCERFPTWTAHYVPLVNQLRPDWDAGRLSSRQLAERIAEQLGVDPNEVHSRRPDAGRSAHQLTSRRRGESVVATDRAHHGRAVTQDLSVDERTRPEQESLEEPGRRVATIGSSEATDTTPASRPSTHQSGCHCMVGWPGSPGHTGRW